MKKVLIALVLSASLYAQTTMVNDPKTNLLWEDTLHAGDVKITYQKAVAYCTSLDLGGFTNWRIPTLSELLSIVDYKRYKPATLKEFHFVKKESTYWTSTPYAKDSDKLWGVSFNDGSTNGITEYYDRYVRCVRDSK